MCIVKVITTNQSQKNYRLAPNYVLPWKYINIPDDDLRKVYIDKIIIKDIIINMGQIKRASFLKNQLFFNTIGILLRL